MARFRNPDRAGNSAIKSRVTNNGNLLGNGSVYNDHSLQRESGVPDRIYQLGNFYLITIFCVHMFKY